MAETIIKEYKKKNKETGEVQVVKTEYTIDKDFIPTKPEEICEEFIINFCMGNKKEEDWLFNQFQERVKDKNGKEIKKPFLQIRKEFIIRHFPKIAESKKKSSAKEDFINMMKARMK